MNFYSYWIAKEDVNFEWWRSSLHLKTFPYISQLEFDSCIEMIPYIYKISKKYFQKSDKYKNHLSKIHDQVKVFIFYSNNELFSSKTLQSDDRYSKEQRIPDSIRLMRHIKRC